MTRSDLYGRSADAARIALVVPNLRKEGGVNQVARFLYRVIDEQDDLSPALVSVAAAADDEASVRIWRPETWVRGIVVEEGRWKGQRFRHFGARWSELEFQRYRPRSELTRYLERFDLVQVVAGHSAWANVARRISLPVTLQVATSVRSERRSQLSRGGVVSWWRGLMTTVTEKWFEERGMRAADAVFVENSEMYEFVRQRCGSEATHFAPPGVDTSRFRPVQGNEARGEHDEYLLSVGRFADPRKNVVLLLEAYGRIRNRCSDAPRLILAGRTPPSREAWRRAEELGVAEQVAFRHDVEEEELAALYRGATAFIQASDEEGLGLALLEAMASGTAVVTTECGGVTTHMDDGDQGLLAPVGDAAALTTAVERLLRQPDFRRRLGRQGRRMVVEEFSAKACAARFVDVYRELLNDGQ